MGGSYEARWHRYVHLLEALGISTEGLESTAVLIRGGDATLARPVDRGSDPLKREELRWALSCALIGDTVSESVDVAAWGASSTQQRARTLQRLSDLLGIHFNGPAYQDRPVPPLKFVRNGPSRYRFNTRRISLERDYLSAADPWYPVSTLVHERTHDFQREILVSRTDARGIPDRAAHRPAGHVLQSKIDSWVETISEDYVDQEIERDAYLTAALSLLRWARRLDGADDFDEMGLSAHQALYPTLLACRRPAPPPLLTRLKWRLGA